MNTFIAFLSSHWILSTIFIILFIAFIVNEWSQRSFGIPELHSKSAVDFINHANAKVIDIRTMSAFQEGHILGSLNVPLAQFEQKWKSLQKYQPDPIIIVCNMGQEAKKAAALFQKNDFKQVYILQGGLSAWRAAGLPLTKKS